MLKIATLTGEFEYNTNMKYTEDQIQDMKDAAYKQGHRMALLGQLRDILRQLGYQDEEKMEKEWWIAEREESIMSIKQIFEDQGWEVEFDDNLHLADIISKHLDRNLD